MSSDPSALRDGPAQTILRVGIVLWPDFTLTAFAGFVDALRLAGDVADRSMQNRCRWHVMSTDGEEVRSSAGIMVMPDSGLTDPRQFDYLVAATGLMGGIQAASAKLDAYLRDAASHGIPLVGLCTGGIALARAGLMAGKRCCVAGFHVGDLEAMEPRAIPIFDRLFLDEGDRITCAGGVAAIDLASHLVERHCGHEKTIELNDRLLVARRRKGEQAPSRTWLGLGAITDARVRRAIALMEAHVTHPLSIAELAQRLHTSERHLERVFADCFARTPSSLYREVRLRKAAWLIDQSPKSITQIAYECGFADASHFARQYHKAFGTTPSGGRRSARSIAQNGFQEAMPVPAYDLEDALLRPAPL